jgi:hypothetical protein
MLFMTCLTKNFKKKMEKNIVGLHLAQILKRFAYIKNLN